MAHNTFVLKVTDEHGHEELHGCGVGGAPFVTAEMVAQHFGDLGHFTNHDPRQKMPRVTKVAILHRSHAVKKTLSDIHTVKELPKIKFEVHPDANKDLKNLSDKESAAASNQPGTVAKPAVESNSSPNLEETARSADPDADGIEEDPEQVSDEVKSLGKPPRADDRPAVEIDPDKS